MLIVHPTHVEGLRLAVRERGWLINIRSFVAGVAVEADAVLDRLENELKALLNKILQRLDNLDAKAAKPLTVGEVAKRLECSTQKLRKGFREGRFPFFFREGVRLLTTEERLADWLAAPQRKARK